MTEVRESYEPPDDFQQTLAAIFGPDELTQAEQDYLRSSGLI